jgi:thiosulfate/3-mercaptopyruvate sulfurtransferase
MEKIYPYPMGDGKVRWVSADWLENHLEKDDLMVLDVQPNVHDYIKEHISGAVYLSEEVLRGPSNGLPVCYVPPEAIQPILCGAGLKNDVPVVVYSSRGAFRCRGDGLEQTIMAYSLARFGHNKIYVLDGGLDKWKEENRPLTKSFPKGEESSFKAKVRREYFVDYEEFKQMKDRDDVIVLDNRPPEIYEGQGPWTKLGHIPGAINLPWITLMDNNNKRLLKTDEEIQSIVKEHNITQNKTIVCYCGTGREATNAFILFKWYLTYPRVKIYEGSYTEWVAHPENPVVVGKNPR